MLRRKPLRRSGSIRRRNPERAARKREEAFGPQSKRCLEMECSVPTCNAGPPYVVAHHEPPRGMGGSGGKDKDTLPLCVPHHQERHDDGIKTFEARHGIVLKELARAVSEGM